MRRSKYFETHLASLRTARSVSKLSVWRSRSKLTSTTPNFAAALHLPGMQSFAPHASASRQDAAAGALHRARMQALRSPTPLRMQALRHPTPLHPAGMQPFKSPPVCICLECRTSLSHAFASRSKCSTVRSAYSRNAAFRHSRASAFI